MKNELTAFLKNRAKQLKSDFNDVPEWIIDATVEFMSAQKIIDSLLQSTSGDVDDAEVIIDFLRKANEKTLDEQAHGFEFEHNGKIIEIIMWQPLEDFTLRQLAEHIGL